MEISERPFIPLRCEDCGNAVLTPRQDEDKGCVEMTTNFCDLCDPGGGFGEEWYRLPDGRVLSYAEVEDTEPDQ